MADLYGFFLSRDDRVLRQRYNVGFMQGNLAIFDHYHSTQRAAFYRLPEAPFLETFFLLVRKLDEELAEGPIESDESIRPILTVVENAVRAGTVNRKRLEKLVSRGPSWRG